MTIFAAQCCLCTLILWFLSVRTDVGQVQLSTVLVLCSGNVTPGSGRVVQVFGWHHRVCCPQGPVWSLLKGRSPLSARWGPPSRPLPISSCAHLSVSCYTSPLHWPPCCLPCSVRTQWPREWLSLELEPSGRWRDASLERVPSQLAVHRAHVPPSPTSATPAWETSLSFHCAQRGGCWWHRPHPYGCRCLALRALSSFWQRVPVSMSSESRLLERMIWREELAEDSEAVTVPKAGAACAGTCGELAGHLSVLLRPKQVDVSPREGAVHKRHTHTRREAWRSGTDCMDESPRSSPGWGVQGSETGVREHLLVCGLFQLGDFEKSENSS